MGSSLPMRRLAERIAWTAGIAIPVGGFAILFGWLGMPFESDRDAFLLFDAAILATTVVLTAGTVLWQRMRGRSYKGWLLIGVWIAGGAVVAALLAVAGIDLSGRRAFKGVFFLGMVGSTVLLVVIWLITVFVRANVEWVREERRRGGVFR